MINYDSEQFINNFIPRVSRTFALAIKFLPEEIRHSVYSAYLLCRVADTIEDSPQLGPTEKSRRLLYLRKILFDAEKGHGINNRDIVSLYESVNINDSPDHNLLGKSHELFAILRELPATQQEIIYHWAGEMAGGMAEFCSLCKTENGKIRALKDEKHWDSYCYYVAGTVGHMLTELFISEFDIEPAAAREMKSRCNSFGLGLQKVNTIKDVPDDRIRGVIFLPEDLLAKHGLTADMLSNPSKGELMRPFVNELIDISIKHLDDAILYTQKIPETLTGVRMFLTVPIFLAIATLNEIYKFPVQTMTGPPVKISRLDVARLTAAAARYSGTNKALFEYYHKIKLSKF
jgi:farnesyl-diphosphate farnesyltransferase